MSQSSTRWNKIGKSSTYLYLQHEHVRLGRDHRDEMEKKDANQQPHKPTKAYGKAGARFDTFESGTVWSATIVAGRKRRGWEIGITRLGFGPSGTFFLGGMFVLRITIDS